jgi:uncharacterized protein (TIGR00369 family)
MSQPRVWEPRNADYSSVVRETFAAQPAMALIGARLAAVLPGEVHVEVPFQPSVTQQHSVFHGGVIGMAVDSACAFAALTLLAPGASGFTVEYKINFLSPASGQRLLAVGRVVKAGRSLTVAAGEGYSVTGDERVLVASAIETLLHFEG